MQQLMKQAQKMQRQLTEAQEELAATEVEGSAGGGLVQAKVTGNGELLAVTIDPRRSTRTTWRPCRTWWSWRSGTPPGGPASWPRSKMGPLTGGLGGMGLGGLGIPGL